MEELLEKVEEIVEETAEKPVEQPQLPVDEPPAPTTAALEDVIVTVNQLLASLRAAGLLET